ncbi:MAG: TetR/AcrR family transcriptional repressor of nem operon [Candidatus Krumholzibacteriia bacterium]|jgi:TetR/AcrR family transcriptional repressor of nem operon
MELFWRHGYNGTSTQALVDHLEINRNSMYSEFGSKQELFEAAIGHYEATVIERNYGPLETGEASLDEITALFKYYAKASRDKDADYGCLLCNTAVEMSGKDRRSRAAADRFMARITAAFANAISNAKRGKELRPGVDIAEQAEFLTSSCLGMLVLLRSKAMPRLLDSSEKVVRRHLESLKKQH